MELFGSSTHTLTHTQHIRFQSINIAYTQRAPWHKKDAAAGDKQTNKQTKPNQSNVGTIHKFEQGTNAEAGGAGAEGRGGEGEDWHTPGQVERFKKKMDQYFAAARAKTLTCQPGSSSVCVLARTIVCGIVTFLVPPSLFPSSPCLTYVNIWACYSSSACPRAACEK